MTEVRHVIESIGRRVIPPDRLPEQVISRARAMRRRRLAGLTLAVVVGGVPLAAGAWALLSSPPDCPPVAEGGFRLTVAPSAGRPGNEVTLSGPVPLFNEDGTYDGTDDKIDLWWNVDPDKWDTALGSDPAEAVPGDATFLGSEELGDSCRFELIFEVPDGEAGDYPVIGLTTGGGGATLYDAAVFHLND